METKFLTDLLQVIALVLRGFELGPLGGLIDFSTIGILTLLVLQAVVAFSIALILIKSGRNVFWIFVAAIPIVNIFALVLFAVAPWPVRQELSMLKKQLKESKKVETVKTSEIVSDVEDSDSEVVETE